MKRPISRFAFDADGAPIAILSCGHPQHVRHEPPFINRPWVTTEEGRRSKLGELLNCLRCEQFELPDDFLLYKKTPLFTETTVPAALQKDHSTKAGVWAKIVILQGRLRYRVESLNLDVELSQQSVGIVVPEVLHRVEPLGEVRFFVEFYRSPYSA
jgi:tellurite methyltransferase